MAVRERHEAWLVFAQLIGTIDYDIPQRDHVPTASCNFLARIQSHELETALEISTWAKGNRSFGASDLTVSRSIFLMNLAILADRQT
jgi:Uri superfamily endonuclease